MKRLYANNLPDAAKKKEMLEHHRTAIDVQNSLAKNETKLSVASQAWGSKALLTEAIAYRMRLVSPVEHPLAIEDHTKIKTRLFEWLHPRDKEVLADEQQEKKIKVLRQLITGRGFFRPTPPEGLISQLNPRPSQPSPP